MSRTRVLSGCVAVMAIAHVLGAWSAGAEASATAPVGAAGSVVSGRGDEVVDAVPLQCTPEAMCCKVCSKGQACGDTCISREKSCHKGRGCACDAAEVCE